MPEFVSGVGKNAKITLSEPADLAKWIGSQLSSEWDVEVAHRIGSRRESGRLGKFDEFWVIIRSRVGSHSFYELVTSSTLVGVAKRFQKDVWPQILLEIEKRDKGDPIKAKQIKPDNAIESRRPAIGQVTRALPAPRQAALTHKTSASAGKQLLLLPPESQEPCCQFPGCTATVDARAWACSSHWSLLSPSLRELISLTYRPGQPASKAYLDAMDLLRRWLKD